MPLFDNVPAWSYLDDASSRYSTSVGASGREDEVLLRSVAQRGDEEALFFRQSLRAAERHGGYYDVVAHGTGRAHAPSSLFGGPCHPDGLAPIQAAGLPQQCYLPSDFTYKANDMPPVFQPQWQANSFGYGMSALAVRPGAALYDGFGSGPELMHMPVQMPREASLESADREVPLVGHSEQEPKGRRRSRVCC